VNGYDGFSGVHENLIWNPYTGCIIYTLNNKVIIE
jgi:WD40 repeat protein